MVKPLLRPSLFMLVLLVTCHCGRTRPIEVADRACLVEEICFNGLDDTCDGQIDEGCECVDDQTGACGESRGACRPGVRTCSGNHWGLCVGATEPASETCNGIDDDCDGEVDQGLAKVCGSNVGTCLEGRQTCLAGSWSACLGGLAPDVERCDGHLDENCDGTVDEGCLCTVGQSRPCGTDVGSCALGTQACGATGQWLTCVGAVQPVAESCDQLDNDCDGAVDEDGVCAPPRVVCPGAQTVALGGRINLNASAFVTSRPLRSVGWTVASRPSGSTANPAPANATSTQFTPDVTGSYELSFCATDNLGAMACCQTQVSSSGACLPPPVPQIATGCDWSWDGRPIVQFSAVPTGLRYELFQPGPGTGLGTAGAGQNYVRPATRINAGAAYPGVTVPLQVSACRVSNPSCCSVSASIAVEVIEDCSVPVAPSAANIAFSEYVANGEGTCPSVNCSSQDTCQAGEAIELTNLSNCPVSLDGFHFAYRNAIAAPASFRWMNFGPTDVVPPRGVYVAIRNRQFATLCGASLGPERPGLFGLKVSALDMQGLRLCSGWFNNEGGGQSELRVDPGTVTTEPDFPAVGAITRIAPYLPTSGSLSACTGVGYNAADSCSYVGGIIPSSILGPNQLGRLWHPCDSVSSPNPACIRD